MKDGADARTQLELALVKAARPELDPSVRALLARLERLEARRARRPPPRAVRRPGPDRAGRRRAAPPRSRRQPPAAADDAPSAPDAGAPARRPPPTRPPPRAAARRGAGADRRPAGHRGRGRRAGRRASPSRRSRVGVELDLAGVTELWPAVLDDLAGATRRCCRAVRARARSALDDDELTIALARVGRVLQAQGRGPAEPRADRPGDPRGHRQLAAAGLRAAPTTTRARDDRTPPAPRRSSSSASSDEFDAEELPAEEES